MAYTLPSTFAIAIAFPSTCSSRTVPGGTSASFTVLTNAIFSPLLASALRSLAEPGNVWALVRPSLVIGLRHLRHHHILLEFVHHLRPLAYFRRPVCQRHIINLVLQLQQSEEQRFRPRRATHHINIHRHDTVHTLQHRICVERPAYARARTHRDAPLRIRHLLPGTLNHLRHLECHRTRHDRQRPQRTLSCPVEYVIDRSDKEVLFEPLI